MGAVVPIGERLDALVLELLVELGHHRARHHLPRMGVVGHQERQIEDVEFLDAERAEFGDRRRQELHRAELQGFELFLVLVERGIRVDFDGHLAVGVFLGELLEQQGRLALGRVRRHHVAEFDDDRIGKRGARQRREQRQDKRSGERQSKAFHRVPPRCGRWPPVMLPIPSAKAALGQCRAPFGAILVSGGKVQQFRDPSWPRRRRKLGAGHGKTQCYIVTL